MPKIKEEEEEPIEKLSTNMPIPRMHTCYIKTLYFVVTLHHNKELTTQLKSYLSIIAIKAMIY